MGREEGLPRGRAPRFEAPRRWRAWHEWPGIVGLATGLALWWFVVTGVLAPLADALARLGPPPPAARGCVVPGEAPAVVDPDWAPHPRASVLARRATPCIPPAPPRDEDPSSAARERPTGGEST